MRPHFTQHKITQSPLAIRRRKLWMWRFEPAIGTAFPKWTRVDARRGPFFGPEDGIPVIRIRVNLSHPSIKAIRAGPGLHVGTSGPQPQIYPIFPAAFVSAACPLAFVWFRPVGKRRRLQLSHNCNTSVVTLECGRVRVVADGMKSSIASRGQPHIHPHGTDSRPKTQDTRTCPFRLASAASEAHFAWVNNTNKPTPASAAPTERIDRKSEKGRHEAQVDAA